MNFIPKNYFLKFLKYLGILISVFVIIFIVVINFLIENLYLNTPENLPDDMVQPHVGEFQLYSVYTGNDGEKFIFDKDKNPDLTCDLVGFFREDRIYCYVPYYVDTTNLVASFNFGGTAYIESERQYNGISENDFSNNVVYTVETDSDDIKTFEIIILQSDLPVIQIETVEDERVLSRTEYINATIQVFSEDIYSTPIISDCEIRVRGNATATLPKLPYKIKTSQEIVLAGLEKGSEFVLLADYYDNTLSRNTLSFLMAEEFGMEYYNETQLVEVLINGEYYGVFNLTNQIDVHTSSVNITSMTTADNSGENLTGGYLLELDGRLNEDMTNGFYTEVGVPVRIISPTNPTSEQFDYMQNYIGEFEKYLMAEDFSYNGNDLESYMDFDSFAAMYWVNEITKNTDFIYPLSFFIHKDINGKLVAGPVWDFDIAGGNFTLRPEGMATDGWLIPTNTWYDAMLKNPEFNQAVIDMYYEHEDFFKNLPELIEDLHLEIYPYSENNYTRTYVGLSDAHKLPEDDTYLSDSEFMVQWFTDRVQWISENVETLRNYVVE